MYFTAEPWRLEGSRNPGILELATGDEEPRLRSGGEEIDTLRSGKLWTDHVAPEPRKIMEARNPIWGRRKQA